MRAERQLEASIFTPFIVECQKITGAVVAGLHMGLMVPEMDFLADRERPLGAWHR